jgi:hypothetical protein
MSIKQSHLYGKAELIRFADDMVFAFENQSDGQRFYKALPKRLTKAGLEMHTDKSQLILAGKLEALKAYNKGQRLPTFNFLGFTCYWGKARNNFWRLKYTSRRDRFAGKLKGMRLSIIIKKGLLIFKILLSFYITSSIIIFNIFSSITSTINSKNYRMMDHPV